MDIRRLGTEIPNLFEDQSQVQEGQQAQEMQQAAGIASTDSTMEAGAIPSETISSSSQALTGGNPNQTFLPDCEDPNVPPGMPYLDQGSANACGTTSLAMIMTYLGVPETHEDIDSDIRRMDIFTAPHDIIEYAQDHGLEAEGYNNGSWDELKSQIDAGHPCECLIESNTSLGGSANGAHYVAIVGHETDPATGQEYVLYHDPNWGDPGHQLAKVPVQDFEKMWNSVSEVPGSHNFYIAFGKDGTSLPPSRLDGMEGTLGTADGISNVTNGLNRLYSPDSVGDFVHGIPQLIGGAFQTVGCGIGGGIQLGAQWLNDKVEGIPVLENIVQPLGDIFNGAGAVVADVFNAVGETCDDVGDAFGDLFDGDFGGFASNMGDAVGDVVGGVADAVGDAASAVGDAVSDFFSGW